ncbi:hypothetical protein B0H14DRAFT_2609311 [Mycena olivaceomarginata]|nr:hypothetical protein B0H14DRAFT_2609311 [Mycena olivaceomarginata]
MGETESAREESAEIEASTLQVDNVAAKQRTRRPSSARGVLTMWGRTWDLAYESHRRYIRQLQRRRRRDERVWWPIPEVCTRTTGPGCGPARASAEGVCRVDLPSTGTQNEGESAEPDLKMVGEEELVP